MPTSSVAVAITTVTLRYVSSLTWLNLLLSLINGRPAHAQNTRLRHAYLGESQTQNANLSETCRPGFDLDIATRFWSYRIKAQYFFICERSTPRVGFDSSGPVSQKSARGGVARYDLATLFFLS